MSSAAFDFLALTEKELLSIQALTLARHALSLLSGISSSLIANPQIQDNRRSTQNIYTRLSL